MVYIIILTNIKYSHGQQLKGKRNKWQLSKVQTQDIFTHFEILQTSKGLCLYKFNICI